MTAVDRAIGVYLSRVRSWRDVLRSDAVRLDPELAAEARAQLEREAKHLVALLDGAVSLQVGVLAWALGELLEALFDAIAFWPEIDSSREAVDAVNQAAQLRQHLGLQARALYGLALHEALHGRQDQAHRLLGRALVLAQQAGDGALLQAVGMALSRLDGRDWAWPDLTKEPPAWVTERPATDAPVRSPNGWPPPRAEGRAAAGPGPTLPSGGWPTSDPTTGPGGRGGPGGPGGRRGGGPGPPPPPSGGGAGHAGGGRRSTKQRRSRLPSAVYRIASEYARSFEASGSWTLWEGATRVRRWAADRAPDRVRALTYQELSEIYARRGLRTKAADAYSISQELEHRHRDARTTAPNPGHVEAFDPSRAPEHPTASQRPLGDHEVASLASGDPMATARPVLAPDAWDATRSDIVAAALAGSAAPMPRQPAEPPVRAAGAADTGLDAGLAAVRRVRGARTPSVQPVTFGRR